MKSAVYVCLVVNAGDPCSTGVVLTASSGTINSPGHDVGKYPNNVGCKWQIIAPADKVKLAVMSV